jgi:hypothetical protein
LIAFFDFTLIVLSILLILGFATQIIIPLFSGKHLFPLFRKKSAVEEEISKAEEVLEEVAEVKHLQEMVREVKRQKAGLKKKE